MTGKLVTALALGAALLSANPAAAATCKKDADCKGGEVCHTGKCVKATAAAPAATTTPPATTTSSTGAVNTGRLAWGGIGFYDFTSASGDFNSFAGGFFLQNSINAARFSTGKCVSMRA